MQFAILFSALQIIFLQLALTFLQIYKLPFSSSTRNGTYSLDTTQITNFFKRQKLYEAKIILKVNRFKYHSLSDRHGESETTFHGRKDVVSCVSEHEENEEPYLQVTSDYDSLSTLCGIKLDAAHEVLKVVIGKVYVPVKLTRQTCQG